MISTEAFFAAISSGDHVQLGQLLHETPALASTRNAQGVSPLLYALYNGKRDLVPILLGAAPPLNIFEASATGNIDMVRQLLAADSTVAQAFTADGFTAMHLAAFFSGDVIIASLLLENGADVNAVSQNSMLVMPLHSALAGRNAAFARFLVERGANVNAQQADGFTALHEAAQNGDTAIAEFLLAHGADPSLTIADGRNAAAIATAEGHADLAQQLAIN